MKKRPLSVQQVIGMVLGLIIMVLPLACSSDVYKSTKKETTDPNNPKIAAIYPASGPAAGGMYLLVTGDNFIEDSTNIFFGKEEADDIVWVSKTQLKVLPPAGPQGNSVDVVAEVEFAENEDDENPKILRGFARDGYNYQGIEKSTVVFLGLLIFLLALLGLPLFLVISAAAILGYALVGFEEGKGFFLNLTGYGQYKAGLGTTIFNWVTDMGNKPLFIAIPLFTFAGSLMSESGAPTRLVNVARSLVGWVPGGLAWVTLLVCCFFTAFTGASGVTIIALGGLLFPILVKEGYGENYSLGLLTTGGSLGLLIPPSLPVIVYGIIAGLDADVIWDAGVGPMILIVLLLGGHAVFVAIRGNVPRHSSSRAEIWAAIKAAAFEIPLPIAVVFGIKGGYVTATEASAVTAFWVLVVEVFIYKDISLKELPGVIKRSMILVGGLIVIIGFALAFTTYLTKDDVPQKILGVMQKQIDSQLTFLLMLNVFLLIVGCLMDIFSAILVVVPLIAPVALGFGVDPYHLAIIFLVNLEIGYSTPPVGINLFISSMRFRRPVFQLYRASIVFIAVLLVGLIIITYMPSLTLGRFDLPQATIVNEKGEAFEKQTISMKEREEKVLVCRGTIAEITLEKSLEFEQDAHEALTQAEDIEIAKAIAKALESAKDDSEKAILTKLQGITKEIADVRKKLNVTIEDKSADDQDRLDARIQREQLNREKLLFDKIQKYERQLTEKLAKLAKDRALLSKFSGIYKSAISDSDKDKKALITAALESDYESIDEEISDLNDTVNDEDEGLSEKTEARTKIREFKAKKAVLQGFQAKCVELVSIKGKAARDAKYKEVLGGPLSDISRVSAELIAEKTRLRSFFPPDDLSKHKALLDSLAIRHEQVKAKIASCKTTIASGSESAENKAAATKLMEELNAQKAPYNALAAAYKAKNKARVNLEGLHNNAKWSCRDHDKLDVRGKTFNLSSLKPGTHRISLTVTSNKHIDQVLMTVEVDENPDLKKEEDDSE